MTSVLVTALFTFAALAAISAIVGSLRRYGPAALALRGQLRNCSTHRSFDWRTAETRVTRDPAKVLRPRFARPSSASALPAAA